MRLSRLTAAEMLPLSDSWLATTHPASAALKRKPEVVALLPHLRAAHEKLLGRQPGDNSRAAELTAELEALDIIHDDTARGIDHFCQAAALLAESPAGRDAWLRIHKLLLPTGLGIVNLTYSAEAGSALLLKKRLQDLSPADAKLLKTQQIAGHSMQAILDHWLDVAAGIGERERQRATLDIGPSPAELLAARMDWVRVVSAVLAMADLTGLSTEPDFQTQFLAPLEAAVERAARRRKAPPDPESPPNPTPPPAPPTA